MSYLIQTTLSFSNGNGPFHFGGCRCNCRCHDIWRYLLYRLLYHLARWRFYQYRRNWYNGYQRYWSYRHRRRSSESGDTDFESDFDSEMDLDSDDEFESDYPALWVCLRLPVCTIACLVYCTSSCLGIFQKFEHFLIEILALETKMYKKYWETLGSIIWNLEGNLPYQWDILIMFEENVSCFQPCPSVLWRLAKR